MTVWRFHGYTVLLAYFHAKLRAISLAAGTIQGGANTEVWACIDRLAGPLIGP